MSATLKDEITPKPLLKLICLGNIAEYEHKETFTQVPEHWLSFIFFLAANPLYTEAGDGDGSSSESDCPNPS